MKNDMSLPEKELMDSTRYMPSISLLMPFEPRISLKTELDYKLKLAIGRAESQLLSTYPAERAFQVIKKLKTLVSDLDFDTRMKSIALFVSPVIQKVFYLDMPVEEKIIIDESFEIRDLVLNRKGMHHFLVLILSSRESRLYLVNNNHFIRLAPQVPEEAEAFKNDIAERVANFSDPTERKEILLDKFLLHADEGLTGILRSFPLPVFVMAPVRTAGHFKKLTRHDAQIVSYITGNYDESREPDLQKALAPYVSEWKKEKTTQLIKQLDTAKSARKLVSGVEDVWQEAAQKKGRLLVVEKNFIFPAEFGKGRSAINPHDHSSGNDLYIKDAVDDIIEKVLSNGGDVEFVEEGQLKELGRIAMVLYY